MPLNSKIIQLKASTYKEVCLDIARRVKQRRLELNLTQAGLASRADVNVETYRKFERTGKISLENLVKIGFVFDAIDDFEQLFLQEQFQNLDELLGKKKSKRERGKRNE